jgi:hypothetical protein
MRWQKNSFEQAVADDLDRSFNLIKKQIDTDQSSPAIKGALAGG